MECLPVWSVWSSTAQEDTCKLWKKSLHTPLQLVIPAKRLASQASHPLDSKILSLDHMQIAARHTNMLLSITHPALNAFRLNKFNCILFSIHKMEMLCRAWIYATLKPVTYLAMSVMAIIFLHTYIQISLCVPVMNLVFFVLPKKHSKLYIQRSLYWVLPEPHILRPWKVVTQASTSWFK